MQLQNIVIVFVLKICHDFKDCMDSGTSKEDDFFLHECSKYRCTIALWNLCIVRASSLATESLKVKNVYLCIYS